MRVGALLCLTGVSSALSGCARHSDRDWVIREFNVPQEVELVVQSTPEDESHWAERKNLFLSAAFRFTPTQYLQYSKSVEQKNEDWHPLPVPPELQKSVEARFDDATIANAINKAAHGFYYLKTARGANLLKTNKRAEWQTTYPDIELAILNADSAELKVFVKQ